MIDMRGEEINKDLRETFLNQDPPDEIHDIIQAIKEKIDSEYLFKCLEKLESKIKDQETIKNQSFEKLLKENQDLK